MRDKLTMADELQAYASKHRMMFGRTPENDLFLEIVKCLQAEVADTGANDFNPKPKPKTKREK